MKEKAAEEVSWRVAEFWEAESKRSPDLRYAVRRVEKAAYNAARDLLPDDAVAALIQREGDNAPEVIAVAGQQVYLFSLDGVEDGDSEIGVAYRSMHIDPRSAAVKLETKFWDRVGDGAAPRSDKWHFTLPDETSITIETRFDPGRKLEPREAVALKLAEAFGMEVPAGKSAVEPLVARAA
jgi:hypothetical protein